MAPCNFKLNNYIYPLWVALLIPLFTQNAHAIGHKTIWCKNLNMSCPSQKDWAKHEKNCENLARESYNEAILESETDPQSWQLQGFISPKDYAEAKYQLMYSICMDR